MAIEFTAHNIRLDDGSFTRPTEKSSVETYPWFLAARRILEAIFPGDKSHLRIADLGSLEGGYAVEFARMGFQTLGIEVRESNIAVCNYVKSRTHLPNLWFTHDNALNIAKYGRFDAIFCSGLLYHLDKPKAFLEVIAASTAKLLILQTHFSTESDLQAKKFNLSPLCENEGLFGRWFPEFPDDDAFNRREIYKWSAWDNRKSFWIQREYLVQTIQQVGFDIVLEQFDGLAPADAAQELDGLAPAIAEQMLRGYYHTDTRGAFAGIKTQTSAG